MLVELRIRDYAVVEDLTLELGPGLNALTGETGAGKSIIVGALSLLLGERASSGVVRAGAERALVEGVFDVAGLPGLEERLEELGYRAEEGHLILRREVATEGRNRAWVNGSPATATVVGELGNALVDLHGQHEHQTLLRGSEQRRILDAFAGILDQVDEVTGLHGRLRALAAAIDEREARGREADRRADFLRFQLGEIDGARIVDGEDEQLEVEARRLEHAEDLAQGVNALHELLYGGEDAVAERLAAARQQLSRLVRFDPGLEELASRLLESYHAVEDVGRRLGDYASGVEYDPVRLEQIRKRLDALFRLKRKYGPQLEDVVATSTRVRDELRELDEAEHDLEGLNAERERVGADLRRAAAVVSESRRAAVARLEEAVGRMLPAVGLGGATFAVRIRDLEEIGATGAEGIDFLVSTNAGFDPMPLARIASGGELSRVMLALKSVLADVDRVPVLVFDEIDAGIGGVVATAVASALADVAVRHQVFVVTHLAQLASRAAAHLLVEKGEEAGRATTTVRALDGDARVAEIARMLGGDPESATSREHARELLATR